MNLKVAVNTTPIIALGKIERLNILRELYEEIIIPVAVKNEVTVKNDLASRRNSKDGAILNAEKFYS